VKLIIFILTICFFSCDYGREFENEFKEFISKTDSISGDGDILHPKTKYFKNGKIIASELDANPSCGNILTKEYFDENEIIEKIVTRKDFFTNGCDTFDSIYVIFPKENKLEVYAEKTNFLLFKSKNLIREEIIEIDE